MARQLDQDLLASEQIGVRCTEDYYAQNLYAALCNMQWQPVEMWAVLSDEMWSCSWRGAGGIIANIRNQVTMNPDGYTGTESYIQWYCSGLAEADTGGELEPSGYVPEGKVTAEIARDLLQLGWHPVPHED